MTITIKRGYKYPVYPDEKQRNFFEYMFWAVRFLWNLLLSDEISNYKETGRHNLKLYTAFKTEFPELYNGDSSALSRTRKFLKSAFDKFFHKTARFPRFKSVQSKQSYSTNQTNNNIRIEGNGIKLPKLKDPVKANIYRPLPEGSIIKQATVSRDKTGRYWVSLSIEYTETINPVDITKKDISHIGLDYKSDGLYMDSFNNIGGIPRFYTESMIKLKRMQRRLSKKIPGSNNYKKLKRKIAKLLQHIANQRDDFLQKLSTEIARVYDVVSVEDINLKAISSHKSKYKLGRYTLDNGYGKFLAMLQYKLEELGKYLIKIDKTYPSSQICSCCGYKNPETKNLSNREIICPVCGYTYDRDYNAAVNIDREGLRKIRAI